MVIMISGTFFVVSIVTPYFLIPLGPILIIYFFLQGTDSNDKVYIMVILTLNFDVPVYFTRTRRQVKRLESIAKSPIFSHFTESIQVRYKVVDRFDNLTNSGSNNDPSVQPAAEILHRERGKGDVPPSLQLYQVVGVHQRQIELSR